MDKHEARNKALAVALDYHSRTFAPINYQNLHTQHGGTHDRRPTPDEIIATAEKFVGFILVDRKTVQPRGRKG